MRNESRLILELAFGTPDADRLTESEERKIAGDVAFLVGLDEQLEVASVVIGGNRRIGAQDVLAVYLSLYGDVPSYWKAEDVVGIRKREFIARWSMVVSQEKLMSRQRVSHGGIRRDGSLFD